MHSWRTFLSGLLSNLNERQCECLNSAVLCPIVRSSPYGWYVVMLRADSIPEGEWDSVRNSDHIADILRRYNVENKRCSFGRLDGKVVAVDYG